MPYNKISELPPQAKHLPKHGKHIYMKAFNNALKQYGDEKRAFATAMAAVENKYKKNGQGKWVEKSGAFEIPLISDYGDESTTD